MAFHARRLPHIHVAGQPIFLTWRLAGSLPAHRRFPPATTSGRAFVAMDRLLGEARIGPVYLHRPEIARLVVEAIHYQAHPLAHYVRDEAEFRRIARYIEWNPVKGGLVGTPEEYSWSSARPIGQSAAG